MVETYYIPQIDPLIDVISALGFFIGIGIAVYMSVMRDEPFRHWFPFIAIALSTAFLGAEGGALDFFAPGVYRIIAMVLLVLAEVCGAFAALKTPFTEVDQK